MTIGSNSSGISTVTSFDGNSVTGAAGTGGAITNTGTLTIGLVAGGTTTSFANNQVTGANGLGGAINSSSSLTTNTGTSFSNNATTGATSGGGAIYAAGTANITNNTFIDNGKIAGVATTANGGAIYNANSAMTISGGSFTDNDSTTAGGAIYSTATSTGKFLSVSNASFSGNSSSTGGAIYNAGSRNATISNNTFTNNTATTNGGAIYNTGLATVTGGSFTTNSATTSGGAIYNTGTLTESDANFISNTANVNGGAIYNTGTETFTNSDFSLNGKTGVTVNTVSGGAIYNASGTTTLTNSSFSNNTATTSGGAIYIASGTVNINSTGKNVTFSGNTQGGSANDISMADASILNLTATGFDIKLNGGIQGTGTINKLGTSNLILSSTSANSLFTGTYNNTAGNVQIQSAFFAGINNFTAGTADIQTGGSLTLNSGTLADTWTNTVISNTGGIINFDGFTHTTGGAYNQSAGTLSLNNNGTASSFTLTSGSNVTGGNINFSGTGNTLSVASGGILNSNVALNLTSGNNFTVAGGTATLNGTGTGIDTWAGTVNISSGTLNINSITSNGIYNQTGGTTTIDSASNITLLDSSNLGGGSLVTNGTLNLSNTAAETVATLISGTGTVNKKDATGTSTFTANESGFTGTYNQTVGGVVIQNSFFSGINNFNGGTASIGTGGSLTLNSGDSWTTTNISTSGGALTLDGFSHITGGTYNQTSGTLHLNNGSYLMLDGSSAISGGVVDYTGSGSVLDITINGSFSTGATLVLTLNTENIFRVSGGTATLSSTDTWSGLGKVDLTSGSLTLSGTTTNGVYTQSGGTLSMTTGATLTLGSGSTISGGTVVYSGTGVKTLDVATGGVFASDAAINITSGNNFNVSGGTATLNGSGTGIDTWAGNVNVSGGTLTLNSIISNGIYNQTGGTTTLASGSLTLLNTSNLGGGNLVANGTLNLSNTSAQTVATAISGTGTVNKNAAGISTFTADNSGFTGTFNLATDGIIVQNKFFGGSNKFTGASTTANIQTNGSLTLNSGDTWTNTNISTTGGSLTLDGFSHLTGGTYNQTSGALHLNNASSLTLSTSNAISGGTVDFGGTGNLLNIATGGTFGTNTALNLTTNNTFRVSGGTATLGNNTNWSGLGKVDLTLGSLTLDGATANGIFTQSGGTLTLSNASGTASKLTLGTGSSISAGNVGFTGTGNLLDISAGATFASGATLNLIADNTFRISGGTATLTNADTWIGDVNITGGTLALNSITSNGIYNQAGGTTTLASGSNLSLGNTSELSGGNLITNGTLNLANTTAETVATQITGTGTVNKNAAGTSTFTADNSGFTGTYNQTAGGVIIQNKFFSGTNNFTGASTTAEIQTNGSLTLNSGDSWTNTNISTTGGSFTLDGFSHTSGGTYNQASGALHLNNTSSLALGTGSTISGGTIDFGGTGNVLSLGSGGSIDSSITLNLTTNNTLRVAGGTVTLGNNITWSGLGKIDVTDGTFTATNLTSGGIFNQSGGTSNFINSNLNMSSDIILSGGTMNINAGNGGSSYLRNKITATGGIININKSVDSNPTDGTVYINNSIDPPSAVNLYNGTMTLSSESYINGNNLGIYGGTINTQNSLIGTMALNNLTFAGNANWLIDVDLANKIGDKITSTNPATGSGLLNISGINLWSDAAANLTSVVVADSNTKNYLSTSVSEVNGALFKYGVAYSAAGTNGVLNFTKTGISPNAITGDVAQTSTFLLQTAIDRQFFGNIDSFMSFPLATRESTICCALANGQTTGAACPISGNGIFSPIYSCDLNRGIWAKNFVSFENIPLNNGPNVSTIEYGTLIGGDAPITNLGHGFVGNTSAYVGYLGSNQNYNRVGVSQNGALIGLAENMVKGNLFLTAMASVGYTLGNAKTPWGMDNFSSLFAGLATKGGYNFEFKDGEYIIQPNLMLAYTFTNTPPYRTASGLDINTKPLNALQVAPGVKLIKNLRERKGQIYLVTNYVQNIMDNTHFSANDIELPQLSIAPYVEYGTGYQGVWKDRFTGFFQILFRGGGRNGVVFQLGLRWAF